ncbi:N-6 DNA methylase [bacterium]|nr:N-6 DNA methylase [bacterium]
MPNYKQILNRFRDAVNKQLKTGRATEQSFYNPIEDLVQDCCDEITAQAISSGDTLNKPDITAFRHGKLKIGLVEVKDTDIDIEAIQNSYSPPIVEGLFGETVISGNKSTAHNTKQFSGYLKAYKNLIYTNVHEWRWYRKNNPKPVKVIKIGHIGSDGLLHLIENAIPEFESMMDLFLHDNPEAPATAKALAVNMARLAKEIRKQTEALSEAADVNLKALFQAFKKELVHSLTAKQFADMYAQTIAYGLFTARMMQPNATDFSRATAAEKLPKTNPFLRKVFNSFAFDLPNEIIIWVDDIADLLKAAEIDEIKKDIQGFRKKRHSGDGEAMEKDPIIYFYEPFLAEYDPKERERRGVYYTPLPVVSYIVRSIDELLIKEFDKPMGLADDDVIILDPACGTGTFLYEVFRVIYEKIGKRSKATWSNSYVPKLLKRVFGFELLMAPYTIAHLKLAEFLADETGYDFESNQRIGIYLTNTLEEAESHAQQLRIGLEGTIATERAEADEVKEKKRVMVILGNPPYSGHSQNKGKWIEGLLKKPYDLPDGSKRQSYYEVDGASINERNPKWLQDDYVKFLRWSQWRIDKTGEGILGMITNHGYLDNPTFRGMRQSLMGTFNKTYIYDIHGNSKKKETAPDGGKDENVFDIQQGVSIGLFVKNNS